MYNRAQNIRIKIELNSHSQVTRSYIQFVQELTLATDNPSFLTQISSILEEHMQNVSSFSSEETLKSSKDLYTGKDWSWKKKDDRKQKRT